MKGTREMGKAWMDGSCLDNQLGKQFWLFWNTLFGLQWSPDEFSLGCITAFSSWESLLLLVIQCCRPTITHILTHEHRRARLFDLGISVRKELRRVPGLTHSCYRWGPGDLESREDIFHKPFAPLFCGCQAEASFKSLPLCPTLTFQVAAGRRDCI